MSSNEKMEVSPNDSGFSKDVFQDLSQEVSRNFTRTVDENLPTVGELAPENQCLPSLRSANVSSQLSDQSPLPSSQTPNDCLHNKDAFTSRQQPMASSMSVLEDLDAINTKINQKDLSPFAASRNADFASPPERCTTPVNRWLSRNLKETNSPSPEKRSVETDAESTPGKRLRKTPVSGSGKPGTETESCTPKLGHSAISDTFYKSRTNLHFQQIEVAMQKYEEAKSPNSPSTPIKRKGKITRKCSIKSETANDPILSNSISPSSAANIIDTSPSYLQMQGCKVDVRSVDESPTARKTIFGDSSASSEVLQSDLPVKETTSAVHSLTLTDKTYCANPGQASESQTSQTEDSGSNIEVNKIQNSSSISAKETQSASNVADATVETQILESSLFNPIILNPHLSSSCHLSRQSNSSVTNVPGSILELGTSDKKKKNDQNLSDSSNRTSTPEGKSISQSKNLSSLRSRGIDRRSVSDETLTTRNLAEIQAERNLPKSVIRSQSKQEQTSRSFPEISKTIYETICVVQPLFQGMFARSPSNTALPTSNSLEFLHSGPSNQLTQSLSSNQSSMSRSNPELQMHQNRNAPLQGKRPRFFSGDTSRSRCQLEGVSDICPPHIDVVGRRASTSNYQPKITAGSSTSDQASTSRNQSEMTSNVNPMHIDISQGQASTSRYQPIAAGVFSFPDPSAFPTWRNEPDVGELFTVRDQPSTEDSSSSDEELDSSKSVSSSEDQPEKRPECVVQARLFLQSVLKEIMMYNKEDFQWGIFERSFRRIAKECSELDTLNLITDLGRYLANKAYDFFDTALFTGYEMAEKHTLAVYAKLTVIVIDALAFTLTLESSRVYFRIFHHHMRFRSLYDNFLSCWDVLDVESIQNEASRNWVKTLREMIQRLMLVVLAAFRQLLMYVGENISEIYFGIFERALSGEDKMYFFRREIG